MAVSGPRPRRHGRNRASGVYPVARMDRLSDQDRLKSELVATVSHEMRRPLTAVIGFAQTLRTRWDELPPELRTELLERVEQNAQALEHMVGQLLDYSRLELGQFRLELRSFELAGLVDRVVANLAPDLAEHEVRTSCPRDLLVLTEPYAFERVLGNLLANAAKFSPSGSPIDIAGERKGDRVELSVRDGGPGVPEAERALVFDRFYRGRSTVPGAGLGLSVVKELVELHGGEVRVEAGADGTGSVFTVSLPAG